MKIQFCLYFLLFFLFSVIGWLYEVALALIYGWGFVNRGFLFGPYLPIYGFGALLLIVTLHGVMAKKRYIGRVPVTPLLVFALIVLITTVVEYLASWGMELIFHQRWWDYSDDFLNINGRVCPRTSFRFGIGGMLFLYVLTPLFTKWIKKIPQCPRLIFSCALLAVMTVDFLIRVV